MSRANSEIMGGLLLQAEVISTHAQGMCVKALGHPLIGKEPTMVGFLNWLSVLGELIHGLFQTVVKLVKLGWPFVSSVMKVAGWCTGQLLMRAGFVSFKTGKALLRTKG